MPGDREEENGKHLPRITGTESTNSSANAAVPPQITLMFSISTWLSSVRTSDLDPAVFAFKLPDQIQWSGNSEASQNAVLYGDPSKTLSLPSAGHPHDGFITVLSRYLIGRQRPQLRSRYYMNLMPAGTFVTYFGEQLHDDGAENIEAILEIVGEDQHRKHGSLSPTPRQRPQWA